ncbi:hypothetical protein GCM10027199_36080 [Amycolatopsis magusensis]
MVTASRGEMPKKPGSKSATPGRNPPCRLMLVPRSSVSAEASDSVSQPRPAGKPEMASPPEATSSHNDSGESMPPGKRQLIATIAIGSEAAATSSRFCRRSRSASFIATRSASTTFSLGAFML